MTLKNAHDLMKRGLDDRLFTGAALMAVRGQEILIQKEYGTLGGTTTLPVTEDTLFDLASLTKVLATTPSWMLLTTENHMILDAGLESWFPNCPDDKAGITPRMLLAHASGLPAWRPYYLLSAQHAPRQEFTLDRILSERLEGTPGTGCIYSDLGFMLLAFLIQACKGQGIDRMAGERIFKPLGLADDLMFKPLGQEARIILTRQGDPPGLVHDLNAEALGGVAGHAGLFGTARGVAALATEILQSLKSRNGFFDQRVTRTFCTKAAFKGCTRALGWDTPSSEGSSSGRYFSPQSLGHTGFTGTSLWIDPQIDLIVVLLTNRVYMGESDFRIKKFRPLIHDAITEELTNYSSTH